MPKGSRGDGRNTLKNCTKKILMNWITTTEWSKSLKERHLECEVKGALGSTTVNKASAYDEIPVELFKTLKEDAINVLHSICQQIWKTQQGPQDWKRSILIQIPKKGSTKECANHWTVALISHANSLVQFIHSVVSDSLQPHGLQHARPPCPSPTPGACSNSCPLSWWCHPTISSSVIPFSFCPQSFPISGSFPMSQSFTSGGQSIGVSASASVLRVNIQDWFLLGLTDWISLQSKGLSRVFSNTTVQKHQFFGLSYLYNPTLTSIHDYWKNHNFD